jgi:hypothetical protein
MINNQGDTMMDMTTARFINNQGYSSGGGTLNFGYQQHASQGDPSIGNLLIRKPSEF